GNAIRRPLPVFVLFSIGLPRSPRERLATTAICPFSRSTFRQRKAQISPRRRPHRMPSGTGIYIVVPRAASSILAVASVSIVFISLRWVLGGFPSAAGLYGIARHTHACVSACFSIV